MASTIQWTIDDGTGDEPEVHDLPAKWQICRRCEGDGSCTPEGLMVITQEDREDWSREEWEDFKAGKYDVPCPDCKSAGKVLEVDVGKFRGQDPALFERWRASEREDAEFRRVCAAERRMGA